MVNLDGETAVEHRVLDGPIGALAVLATGHLVVGSRTGQVTVMDAPGDTPADASSNSAAARDRVATFLAATTELDNDADLDDGVVRTDGVRVWDSEDLDEVATASDADPIWLRLWAAINAYQDGPAPRVGR